MSFLKVVEDIDFLNNTDHNVLLEAWQHDTNQMQTVNIPPKIQTKVTSCVGEWHMTSGKSYKYIGKFRSKPCASGNYSWMETYEYVCCYQNTNNNALITLSKK